MNAREWPVKTMDKLALVIEHFHITVIANSTHTVVSSCTISITLPHPAVEAVSVNPGPASSDSTSDCSSPALNNDSIGATGVGLFLGGVVVGALGVLLIVGIVGGACLLRRSKHK